MAHETLVGQQSTKSALTKKDRQATECNNGDNKMPARINERKTTTSSNSNVGDRLELHHPLCVGIPGATNVCNGTCVQSYACTGVAHCTPTHPLSPDIARTRRVRSDTLTLVVTPTTAQDAATRDFYPLTADARRAVEAIEYITDHLRHDEEYRIVSYMPVTVNGGKGGMTCVLQNREDWKYVAMIIDRIMLYIFFGVTLGGTLGILLSANTVFEFIDQAQIIEKLKHSYQA
jgi:hypothetical protein